MKKFLLERRKDEQNAMELKLQDEIIALNAVSVENGLALSEADARMILDVRNDILSETGRVEFGSSALLLIIERFMHSTFVSPESYAEDIAAILEIFYRVKDDTDDILSDDEVIDVLFGYFEDECGGDMELMQSRELETFIKRIRFSAMGIDYTEEECDEEDEEDEEDEDE